MSIFTDPYESEARGKNRCLSNVRSLIIASVMNCVAGLENADYFELMCSSLIAVSELRSSSFLQ